MSGEKDLPICEDDFLEGSPPRGRGKAASFIGGTWERRITPAWAGKSPYPRFFLAIRRDHPRVGGEKWEEEKP